MSHKKLRPFIVKVSVLGYFPLLDLVITSPYPSFTLKHPTMSNLITYYYSI